MKAYATVLHASDLSKLLAEAVVMKKITQYAYEQKAVITEPAYELVRYKLDEHIYTAYLLGDGDPEFIGRVPGKKLPSLCSNV